FLIGVSSYSASADNDPWQDAIMRGVNALKAKQYSGAEILFLEALQRAGDVPKRQALTLRSLVLVYANQRRLPQMRERVQQLMDLAPHFRGTEDKGVIEGYRDIGGLLRLLNLPQDAAALESLANRLEAGESFVCLDRNIDLTPKRLSNETQKKAIKAVEALAELAEWTNGSKMKDKTEYISRVKQTAAVIHDFFDMNPLERPDLEPGAVIGESLQCFEEALDAWPRTTRRWVTAEAKVRAAERILGLKSPNERHEEAREQRLEVERKEVEVERKEVQ